MWLRILLVFTLVTASHAGTSRDARELGSCATMKLLSPFHLVPGNFTIHKHEIYRHGTVIHYAIDDQGKVTDVRLVRSSGIKHLDATILEAVKHWRYEPRPGCPAIETDISITIDWF